MLLRCCECKSDKDSTLFAKNRSSRTGFNRICKACKKLRDQKHYELNRDRIIEHNKKYNQDNKDWFYTYCQEYNRLERQIELRRIWRKNNPDYQRDYRRRKPDVHMNVRHMRRAVINGGPREFIALDDLFKRDNGICQICHLECTREEASIDHIRPISKGGHHVWNNVQLAHLRCNKVKGNRWIPTETLEIESKNISCP